MIMAVFSPSRASFLEFQPSDSLDLTESVEGYDHFYESAHLSEYDESEEEPAEELLCTLNGDELFKVSKDVLGIIVRKLDKPLAFLSTCRYLRSIAYWKDLILTLPPDFTRTQTWRQMQQGQKPFSWGTCVKEIHLFQLHNPNVAIDALGHIKYNPIGAELTNDTEGSINYYPESSGYETDFFKLLFQNFPNVEKCFLTDRCYLQPHLEQHYPEKYAVFKCERLIKEFCEDHYLNIRRVKLLIELFSQPQRPGFYPAYYGGNVRGGPDTAGKPTIAYFWGGLHELLNIPTDDSLPAMLDLYQQISQSELYRKAREDPNKAVEPDNRLRLFLRALALRPALWEFTLFINKEIAPILYVHYYYSNTPYDRIQNYEAPEKIEREYESIRHTLNKFEECLCEDTMTILEYIATHITGLLTLYNLSSNENLSFHKAPAILFTYLDAVAFVLRDEQLRNQPARLFRRLFVLHAPEIYFINRISKGRVAVDEKTYRVISGEEITSMILCIQRHLSVISDQEFDEFASFLRDKFTVRTCTLTNGRELDTVAERFKSESKF